jgi:hypothetical protein
VINMQIAYFGLIDSSIPFIQHKAFRGITTLMLSGNKMISEAMPPKECDPIRTSEKYHPI